MDPTLARYPFLEAARDAVTAADSSLEELLGGTGRSAAVDRAIERIERAIAGEQVGPPRHDHEVELLSYPLARIIVSLVDDRRVTSRYVSAEARSAIDRLVDGQQHDPDGGFSITDLLDEFDIDAVRVEDGHEVAVTDYLGLATELDEERWRLVNQPLANGQVLVADDDLPGLLEAAVRRRVGLDLPLAVPDDVAERLDDAVDEVEEAIGTVRLPESFPVIDPAAFPPCMSHLVEQVEAGQSLARSGRYALASFLTSLGLAPDGLNRVIEPPVPDELIEMARAVGGEEGPTQFPPGTCETMVAYGDCVAPDELCERIEHPLEYYHERVK